MCLFSKPKTPEMQTPPPPPAPAPPPPVVAPSQVSPITAAQQRQKRVSAIRTGIASTIKTGPRGIVGSGPELSGTTTGKTTLG